MPPAAYVDELRRHGMKITERIESKIYGDRRMNIFELVQATGKPGVSIVKINDRINLGNTDALRQLAESAHKNGATGLVLDLTATPSITSAGLRAVLSIYKLFGAEGLKLISPSPDVRRTLEIAGMASQIAIYDDLAAALASFR